jgi:hypothetical protein
MKMFYDQKIFIFLMVCGVFFITANANSLYSCDQADKSGNGSSYFLDFDSLQLAPDHDLHNLYGSETMIYVEKENPNAVWVFFPIESWMTDYYKAVASVVATELHKRIDEHSLVPPTKFLIAKNKGNKQGYMLYGSVFKHLSAVTPIMKLKKRDFNDYADLIYQDYNVERNIGLWEYLGLSVPNYVSLGLVEDNKFVRYDYYDAFQYTNPDVDKKCFCTSEFEISDYSCNIEYIKTFRQELHSKYKETLEKLIEEIRLDAKKYLEERDLAEVHRVLKNIIKYMEKKVSGPTTDS